MSNTRWFGLAVFSVSLCLGGSTSSLLAASPVLSVVTPRGAQRGTEAVFTFSGARLSDAKEVLVYGPGVKGNMAALLDLARSPYPLPLGALRARRSLLSLDNLVEAVDVLLKRDGPIRRPFIVADSEPLDPAEMIRALRRGFGRRAGLVPVPPALLHAAARLAGREEAFQRLANPLVASAEALRRCGWQPPLSTPDGLAQLARSSASGA